MFLVARFQAARFQAAPFLVVQFLVAQFQAALLQARPAQHQINQLRGRAHQIKQLWQLHLAQVQPHQIKLQLAEVRVRLLQAAVQIARQLRLKKHKTL